MNIVRKIKLEQLGYYVCKNEKEKEFFFDLKEIKLEEYPNSRFWFKDNKFIFEYETDPFSLFWINDDIWIALNEKNIHQNIKEIIKNYFKLEPINPMCRLKIYTRLIEHLYKDNFL